MINATSTLNGTSNVDRFESPVRDAAHRGIETVNTWLESVWNKAIVILTMAYPAPGAGMN